MWLRVTFYAAMESLTKESKTYLVVNIMPEFIMIPVWKLLLGFDAWRAKGDNVPLKELLLPFRYEVKVGLKTEGTLENYKNVSAEVLLLRGSNTEPLLRDSQEHLNEILPNSKLIELEGLDHGAAQDYGKPESIAQEIKSFY